MDLGRLRTLRELAARGSMAAVAEAIFLSPSAVSQQIALLEEEAGVELVERRGRGVRLTAAGLRLAEHAGRIIAQIEAARTDLAALQGQVAGEVRVSAFSTAAIALLPETFQALRARYPALEITFEEREPLDSVAALRAWQADAAIIDDLTLDAPDDRLERHALLEDRMHALLPAGHPLARRAMVPLSDLRGESWAIDMTARRYAEVLTQHCAEAGFTPHVVGQCRSFGMVRRLVETGAAISVVPGLRRIEPLGGLVLRPIQPVIPRRIALALRAGERRKPAIAAFAEEIARVARAFGG